MPTLFQIARLNGKLQALMLNLDRLRLSSFSREIAGLVDSPATQITKVLERSIIPGLRARLRLPSLFQQLLVTLQAYQRDRKLFFDFPETDSIPPGTCRLDWFALEVRADMPKDALMEVIAEINRHSLGIDTTPLVRLAAAVPDETPDIRRAAIECAIELVTMLIPDRAEPDEDTLCAARSIASGCPRDQPTSSAPRLHWDNDNRKLTLDGKVIKAYRKQAAENQVSILREFEEHDWPECV